MLVKSSKAAKDLAELKGVGEPSLLAAAEDLQRGTLVEYIVSDCLPTLSFTLGRWSPSSLGWPRTVRRCLQQGTGLVRCTR